MLQLQSETTQQGHQVPCQKGGIHLLTSVAHLNQSQKHICLRTGTCPVFSGIIEHLVRVKQGLHKTWVKYMRF